MGEAKKRVKLVPDFENFFAQLAPHRRILITRTGIAEKAGDYLEFYKLRGYSSKRYAELAEQISRDLTSSFRDNLNPNVQELILMKNVQVPQSVVDYRKSHEVKTYASRDEWAFGRGLVVVIAARKKSEDKR